jgi:hypothetical protein
MPSHPSPGVLRLLLPLLAMLTSFAVSCGGSRTEPSPVAPRPTLAEAIAEVEAAPVPAGMDPQVFAQLKAALLLSLEARDAAKFTTATQGQYNEVNEIFVLDDTLMWMYKNVGDYDLNGEVNISDLTPLGAYLGQTSDGPLWEQAKVADGDGNGAITIGDITPIGANFFAQAINWAVFGGQSTKQPFDKLGEVSIEGIVRPNCLQFALAGHVPAYTYFQVKAVDAQGGEGVPSQIAPYEKDKGSIGELEVNLESILIGLNQPAIFGIDVDPALKEVTVEVWELDADGNPVQKVADLKDDGNVGAGDDILLDGHFSGSYVPAPSAAAAVDYFAKVEYKDPEGVPGAATSNQVGLLFYSQLTEVRAQEIIDLIAMHQATLNIYGAQFPTPQAGAQQLFDELKDDPKFEAVGLSESGQGIWWVTKGDLIPCAIVYYEPGERSGGGAPPATSGEDGGATSTSPSTAPKRSVTPRPGGHAVGEPLPYWQLPQTTTPLARSAADYTSDLRAIGNNRVLCLAPYQWQFAPQDETPLLFGQFQQSICPDFEEVLYQNAECTVERFKSMDDFGAVVISSHGDSFFGGYASPMWGGTTVTPDTQCIVLTGEAPTAASLAAYSADLTAGRLIASGVYIFTPRFVREYCDDMPNTVVYIGSCRSTWNASLADAFTGNGAGAFVGYSDYVNSGWAFGWGMDFWTKMLAANSTGTAHTPGIQEADSDPSKYDLYGSGVVKIMAESLRNPGFDAALTGWTRSGDCRGIRHLGFIPVWEGRYMAICSTGLGSMTDSHSALSQRFCVPTGATALALHYNVVSEEPLEFLQSEFDDRWKISLYTPDGTLLTTFVQGSINTTGSWAVAPAVNFDGGDATAFQTGWARPAPIDMTPYRGETVDLVIECNDIGDSQYDTAVLVDKIELY